MNFFNIYFSSTFFSALKFFKYYMSFDSVKFLFYSKTYHLNLQFEKNDDKNGYNVRIIILI